MNLYFLNFMIIKLIHITSVHEFYDRPNELFTFTAHRIVVFLKREGIIF